MMRAKLVMFVGVTAVVLVATACGNKADEDNSRAKGVFDAADIAAIVLQPADAPPRTEFQAEGSGSQTIDDLAENQSERVLLTDAGFIGARGNVFATPGLLEATEQNQLQPRSRLISSLGIALGDAAGADRVLEAISADLLADVEGEEAISSQDSPPGETGSAFSFTALDKNSRLSGYAIIWLQRNAVFVIIAAGVPGATTEAETLSLATKMEERAKSRAVR